MSVIRIAIFFLMPLAFAHSLADETADGKRSKKQAQAVSKEVYDKEIMRVQDAIDHLVSIGISPEDIEPNNLPFSSESFQDCAEQAEESLSTKDELAIATVSCLRRHAGDL